MKKNLNVGGFGYWHSQVFFSGFQFSNSSFNFFFNVIGKEENLNLSPFPLNKAVLQVEYTPNYKSFRYL